ncbi:MAG: hypothetical protein FWE38_03020 [Firmicutes bacterium]|nr:hypothetical protein [Bacillota bacterium]
MGLVVSSFSGTGKSYIAARHENTVDLDVGEYRFVYDGPVDVPFEARKAMRQFSINPEWPANYHRAIIEARGRHDIVFVTMVPEIAELVDVYFAPHPDSWPILETRFRERGNPERFIEIQKMRFDSESYEGVQLGVDEFLEDALIHLGVL